MLDCDFCGGPRANGAALQKDGDGNWKFASTGNPTHPEVKTACRSCVKEKMD